MVLLGLGRSTESTGATLFTHNAHAGNEKLRQNTQIHVAKVAEHKQTLKRKFGFKWHKYYEKFLANAFARMADQSPLDTILKEYIRSELSCGAGKPDENDNYLEELHECLERKGVMRELQAFLRQKLVLVLQDKWPHLNGQTHLGSGGGGDPIHPIGIQLVQDFLCCRKLLFTLSVFAGELGLQNVTAENFGKMRCSTSEQLLEEIGIKKDSEISRQLLKRYTGSERCSMLECLIQHTKWPALDSQDNDLSQIAPSGEDHFIFQNLSRSHNKSENKFDARFKEINEFFNSRKKKERREKEAGIEERLHSLQKQMEKDKNTQIQIAIKKFREEEATRMREEIQHKLEFEYLSKEKDLLTNFKERAQMLKDSLEQEKMAWKAEKERQEEKLKEKEIQLQESIKALENEEVSTFNKQPIESNLLKDNQFLNIIKSLQEENQQLKSFFSVSRPHPVPQRLQDRSIQIQQASGEEPLQRNISSEIDKDQIAFLQYNFEKQSQELQMLKEQLFLNAEIPSRSVSNDPKVTSTARPAPQKDSDLVRFLTESKKRCEKIEVEARNVERTLERLKIKRSRSASPSIASATSTLIGPGIRAPKHINYSYSSILPSMLAEQLSVINAPLRSTLSIPPTRTIEKPLSVDKNQEQSALSNAFANGASAPLRSSTVNTQKQLNDERAALKDEISRVNDLGDATINAPTTINPRNPHPFLTENSIEKNRKKLKESAKVVKAVERGALLFEKVPSSSEAEEDMSYKVENLQNRRISFNGESKSGSSRGREHHDNDDPVRLDDVGSEKSVSLSVSGPNSRSKGDRSVRSKGSASGGEESDFWKI